MTDQIEAADFLARLKGDFEFFCEQMWLELKLDRHHKFGFAERIVARHLASGRRRRGVLAWRYFGKTYLVLFLALWRLVRNPDRRQVIITISMPESRKRIHMAREWIDMVWFLRPLKPNPEQRDSADGFDVNSAESHKDYSLGCKGADGQITGIHGDVIADDIEDENNTISRESRDGLYQRTNEFGNIAGANGEIVVIGTLHSEESVYPKMSAEGYDFITVPILYPTADQQVINLAPELRERLAKDTVKPGDIVAPYRIDPDYIAQERAKSRNFAMQMMLQINVSDTVRFPLKLSALIVFDSARDFGPSRIAWGLTSQSKGSTEIKGITVKGLTGDSLHEPMFVDEKAATWIPYTRTILVIDPSGGGQSETTWYVGSGLNGYVFVHAGGGVIGSASEENIREIVAKAKLHNASCISVEGNLVGEKDEIHNAWANLLRAEVGRQRLDSERAGLGEDKAWNASVEVHWAKGKKEHRVVNVLEPLLAAHRVVVSRSVASDTELQYQLARITVQQASLKQTDRIDAFATLCGMLTETTRIDPARGQDPSTHRRMSQEMIDMLSRFDKGLKPKVYSFYQSR